MKNYYYFFEQNDPLLLKYNFLIIISEESFLQQIALSGFDGNLEKQTFLKLFFKYLNTQRLNISSIPINKKTVTTIIQNYVEICENSWFCNREQYMKETIEKFQSDSNETNIDEFAETEMKKIKIDAL